MSEVSTKPLDPRDIPVVILCGGMGTRLREASEKLPKPLVDIGGKPILWHVMKTYAHYGFRRFILCLGYKSDQIRRYFLDYRENVSDFTLKLGSAEEPPKWHGQAASEDWEITFVDTGLLTGTGAPDQAGRGLPRRRHLHADLRRRHRRRRHRRCARQPSGRRPPRHRDRRAPVQPLRRDARRRRRVTEFNEKPTLADGWVNGGFFVFDRLVVDKYLDDDPSADAGGASRCRRSPPTAS